MCGLTLQQERIGGSANIDLLDVIVCGHGVETNDKPRNLTCWSNMRYRPSHPDVVGTDTSELKVSWCWNCWTIRKPELIMANTELKAINKCIMQQNILWWLPCLTTVETGTLSEWSLVVNTLMLYSTPGLRLSNKMEVWSARTNSSREFPRWSLVGVLVTL